MEIKQRFLIYIKPQRKHLLFLFLFAFIYVLAQLSQPFLLGQALNSALYQNDTTIFFVLVAVCLALSLIGAISDFLFEYSVGCMTQAIIYNMRNDVYRKINSVSIETIFKESHGNLVQMEIGDIEHVANGLFAVFKSLVEGVLAIVVTIIMMFVVNWILAIGVVILSPLSILMSRFVASFSHKYFKRQAKLQSDLTSISLEGIDNIDLVQAMNFEKGTLTQFKAQDEELRKQGKIAQFSASWTNPCTRLVNNTIYAIIGVCGIIMISFSSQYPILNMNIGFLSSFLTYTTQFSKPFNDISSVASEYETALSSFKRIASFLDKENDVDLGHSQVRDIQEITFENMDFSYEPNQHLIENFNEVIKKGQKVAIVGPTGAGKSTLINVLMRFYDPTGGCIRYNGIKGVDIDKASLRANFGMVLQETWIFSGTVMENVRYAKPTATDEEVMEACRKAHADTFIHTLPDGYQTKVSANHGLSDGERQMLTIARVMLLEPDIVILDEATSNVDTRTEKLIGDAFDHLLEGKTSIVIAHRLSTIKNADIILVLKDGHIIEHGNHLELMNAKGFYHSMYSSQFK
jgi:ABC transporter related protein